MAWISWEWHKTQSFANSCRSAFIILLLESVDKLKCLNFLIEIKINKCVVCENKHFNLLCTNRILKGFGLSE